MTNPTNEEYFPKKINKNESKTSLNQIEKHKIKLRTESADYERLHEKL